MNLDDFKPRRRSDISRLDFDGRTLIASESASVPMVLDPLGDELMRWFDGTATVATLSADLAEATGVSSNTGLELIEAFLGELSSNRFLEVPIRPPETVPRSFHPNVPIHSCLGERLALGASEILELRSGGVAWMRIASTDREWLRSMSNVLPERIEVVEAGADTVPTFALRTSRGRTRRLQQLFDAFGNPRAWTHDIDVAHSALGRTVVGWAEARAGNEPWCLLPGVITNCGIVLVHPSLWPLLATPSVRSAIDSEGGEMAPCALGALELVDDAPRLRLPRDPNRAAEEMSWPISGVLAPSGPGGVWWLRQLLHVAFRWDDVHLNAFADLSRLVPRIDIDQAWPMEQAAEVVGGLVRRAP